MWLYLKVAHLLTGTINERCICWNHFAETAMIRERWKQNQKKMTSPVRMHPLLVPPDLSASSRSVMSALRKSTTYGRCQDVSTPSSTHKHQQFPFLETEVTKRYAEVGYDPYTVRNKIDLSFCFCFCLFD